MLRRRTRARNDHTAVQLLNYVHLNALGPVPTRRLGHSGTTGNVDTSRKMRLGQAFDAVTGTRHSLPFLILNLSYAAAVMARALGMRKHRAKPNYKPSAFASDDMDG